MTKQQMRSRTSWKALLRIGPRSPSLDPTGEERSGAASGPWMDMVSEHLYPVIGLLPRPLVQNYQYVTQQAVPALKLTNKKWTNNVEIALPADDQI